MPSINFVNPKNRDWVAPTLKELERGPKIANESVSTNIQKRLIILNQEANYDDSMRILADKGLRPLTYQEALAHSAELIEKLKGKWFWLAGDGKDLKEKAGMYTFDLQGNLKELTGNETQDQKIYVYPGDKQLSLDVSQDLMSRRLYLHANFWPNSVAPVVVGIQI